MSASQQLLLGGKQVAANYIEDVFSTYLYTGNDSTQTINNGIDLAGKGGLVWIKGRAGYNGAQNHAIFDTGRGANKWLSSNTTAAENVAATNFLTSFNATGFSITSGGSGRDIVNDASTNFASWTFRKQPKFFDVVTYTGNGVAGLTIPHNLGSVPGCFIVKRIDTAGGWKVNHRSIGLDYLEMNTTAASAYYNLMWNDTYPTATTFTVGTQGDVNASGGTYVAYLFAHNAGGFGESGTDNVVSCGSTTMGAGITTTTLGYEPQWLLIKGSNNGNAWWLVDNMRGLSQTGYNRLIPNDSGAENAIASNYISITPTGFTMDGSIFGSGNTFIYIAIRRGPMKVPTDGTKVFKPNYSFAPSPPSWHSDNFPVDMAFWKNLSNGAGNYNWGDRLRGKVSLSSNLTDAEVSNAQATFDYQEGWYLGSSYGTNYASWMFRRAPGFFDEVCYTGNGVSGRAINHNLTVAPEMMILKSRSASGTNYQWFVFHKDIPPTPYRTNLTLNTNDAAYAWSSIINTPTTTTFSVNDTFGNPSGTTFVAYLLASCPGVSKVGSYTGNGTTQTINCGFTGGARFVLIKRTDAVGDWYTYDTARGMTTTTDPYLLLNSTAAESASLGSVTTVTTGFALNAGILAAINATGASYIFFAVA